MRMRNENDAVAERDEVTGEFRLDRTGGEIPGSVYFAFGGDRICCPPRNDPLGRRNSIEVHADAFKYLQRGGCPEVYRQIGKTVFFGEAAEARDGLDINSEKNKFAKKLLELEEKSRNLDKRKQELDREIAEKERLLEAKYAARDAKLKTAEQLEAADKYAVRDEPRLAPIPPPPAKK